MIEFTCGIKKRNGWFIIREHGNYPFDLMDKQKYIGKIETGTVYADDTCQGPAAWVEDEIIQGLN